MKKDGSALTILAATGILLGGMSFPGCTDDAPRKAPEEVLKAKKEDVEQARNEAEQKALAEKKAKGKAVGK